MTWTTLPLAEEENKRYIHKWLILNDADYAFECAVMGDGETYVKYDIEELRMRTYRVVVQLHTFGRTATWRSA